MPEGGTKGRGRTPDGGAPACPSCCRSRPPSARALPGSATRLIVRTNDTVAQIARCFILRLSRSSGSPTLNTTITPIGSRSAVFLPHAEQEAVSVRANVGPEGTGVGGVS